MWLIGLQVGLVMVTGFYAWALITYEAEMSEADAGLVDEGAEMTQEYQCIGGVSPQLDAVAAERQGWQNEAAEDLGAQVTRTSDFSFRARQANMRALGEGNPAPGMAGQVGNMAGYNEPSMASLQVTPPAQPALPPSEDRMQVTW